MDGLLSSGADRDDTRRAGSKRLYSGDILSGLNGQPFVVPDVSGRRLPAGEFLIDGLAPGQGGDTCREVVDGLAVQLIANSYLDLGQDIENIEAGDGYVG